jgi:hypothetical protein
MDKMTLQDRMTSMTTNYLVCETIGAVLDRMETS